MVRDLQAADEVLNDSDVVAAIAGDPDAQELLGADEGSEHLLDQPEQDYSVLDADSSQRNAINTVLSGRSLVIHGPPGTGKSQTIANLIAALVARGRKVLFVAEKRAAIDAVLSRLKSVELGGTVLDIHDGTRDRMRICRDLGDTLEQAQSTAAPDVDDLHRRLTDRQRRLARHASALHQVHQPWGVTPFQVQSALLGIPKSARTQVRISAPERISRERADRIRDELREFAHLGGFTLRPASTPWFGAILRTRDEAQQACELAVRVGTRGLPMQAQRIEQACAETGLRLPQSYQDRLSRMQLFAAVRASFQTFAAGVYATDVDRLAAAAGGPPASRSALASTSIRPSAPWDSSLPRASYGAATRAGAPVGPGDLRLLAGRATARGAAERCADPEQAACRPGHLPEPDVAETPVHRLPPPRVG
jgi:hypothetical protein